MINWVRPLRIFAEAYFRYDAATNQLVYRLIVSDASVTTPNMRWTITSAFGSTEVFVSSSVDEAATTFEYGKITTIPETGTQNQESLGAADFGEIVGNQITIRLSLDKVNAAVGSNVLNTRSTKRKPEAQILIGSSLTGGLLLNSDTATGADFEISDSSGPTPTPTPTRRQPDTDSYGYTNTNRNSTRHQRLLRSPTPNPTTAADTAGNNGRQISTRGIRNASGGASDSFDPVRASQEMLDAQINQNHGNQQIVFELLDTNGNVIAVANRKFYSRV